jgi:hypothetical protein
MKFKEIKKISNGFFTPVSKILFLLLVSSCNFIGEKQVDEDKQTSYLPYIKETNGVKQLMVDDAPFVILGGELLNSSASCIEYMKPIWPRVKSMNVNTVLLPITWQQFEPVEGEFDYTLVDSHIKSAYENGLRIVFLWFGSWKNGQSHYTPDWVKTDLSRFPRMLHKGNKITNTISNIHEKCLKADTSLGADVELLDSEGNEKTAENMEEDDQVVVTSADGTVINTYTIVLDLTSVEDHAQQLVEVYPNPTSGSVNISGVEAGNTIRVFNNVGQNVLNMKAGASKVTAPLYGQPAGIYMIIVNDGSKEVANFKLIKR